MPPTAFLGVLLCGALWPGLVPIRAALAGEDAELLAVARSARKSVVRVIWRDSRFSDRTSERNAIVVRADGLLLMAGPPPRGRGTLTVRFPDRAELRARLLSSDTKTALSLLQVDRTHLPALTFRREAVASPSPASAQGEAKPVGEKPLAKPGVAATPSKLRTHAPLRDTLPPLGLRAVMVTGDGSIAFGPIRAHERHGALTDPKTRRAVKTTGLLSLTLAALDSDAGSPLLDERGRVVGLVVGRRETVDAGQAAAAARSGLRLRPTAIEAVAVPASVAALVWPLLQRYKRVPRVALGITTESIDATLAEHLRITGGHVIGRLAPGGVGERQGLRLHDVIVSVDRHAVGGTTTLHDALLPYQPGAHLTLEIVRGGKRLELPIRTGER